MSYIIDGQNRVVLQGEVKSRKITGSRLATILGLNKWSTPFEEWLHMTKVKEKDFVASKHTEAGNVIEGIIIDYLKENDKNFEYVSAEDVYGEDPFKTTFGDFYPHEEIFGGMWDALLYMRNNDGTRNKVGIVEVKTTGRPQDWADGIPVSYQIQAELYAHLEGVDVIKFPVAFLSEVDYIFPEEFVPKEGVNFQTFTYRITDEERPHIQGRLHAALHWWDDHIAGGLSPVPTEKDDDLVELLKTQLIENNDVDLQLSTYTLLTNNQNVLKLNSADVKEYLENEKQLKKVKDLTKKILDEEHPRSPEVDTVSVSGEEYTVSYKRTVKVTETFDIESFKVDHPELYAQYVGQEVKESFRQSYKKNK